MAPVGRSLSRERTDQQFDAWSSPGIDEPVRGLPEDRFAMSRNFFRQVSPEAVRRSGNDSIKCFLTLN